MIIVVILNHSINLIVWFVSLPQMYEFGVGHEKNVVIEKYFFHLEFKLWVRFRKGLKGFLDLFVDIFFHMLQKQEPAYS